MADAELPKPKKLKLTAKQERFAREYLVDWNATAAYRRVYPNCAYSTARTEGARLLAHPAVKEEVEAAQEAWLEGHKADQERLLTEIWAVATADISDFLDLTADGWTLLPARLVSPAARVAVQAVIPTKYGLRLKLFDKTAAFDRLARIGGLYKDLPPLEVLMNAVDPEMKEAIRKAMAEVLARRDGERAAEPQHTVSPPPPTLPPDPPTDPTDADGQDPPTP